MQTNLLCVCPVLFPHSLIMVKMYGAPDESIVI